MRLSRRNYVTVKAQLVTQMMNTWVYTHLHIELTRKVLTQVLACRMQILDLVQTVLIADSRCPITITNHRPVTLLYSLFARKDSLILRQSSRFACREKRCETRQRNDGVGDPVHSNEEGYYSH